MSDEDKRLWWQKRLTPRPDGERDALTLNGGCSANAVTDSVCEEKPGFGGYLTQDDLLACLCWAAYANANPDLSPRQLLGLPAEEPPKVMTKAEIVGELRREASYCSPGSRMHESMSRLALAVEVLPDVEPVKMGASVSPFAGKVARERERWSDAPGRLGTPIRATNELVREFWLLLNNLTNAAVNNDQLDPRTVDWMARYAATIQRAAEDLGLVEQ